jgi:hypothetical protein
VTRRGRQLLIVAAALVALLALPAAAGAATVEVVAQNGHRTPVALDQLLAAPDVRERTYTVRTSSGAARQRTVTGVSLAAVLDAADAEVDQFQYAEVEDAEAAVLFSHDQALDPAWKGSDGPPVFFVRPDGTLGFLRPAAGKDDPNGDDELTGAGSLTIRLRNKIRLSITAKASKTKAEIGEKITFTASIRGAGAGEAARVSWLLGDGRTGVGTEVTHAFRRKGTFRVLATVTTANDPVGASAIVEVRVGGGDEPEQEERSSGSSGGGTASSGLAGAGAGAGTGGTGGGATGGGSGAGAGAAASAAPSTPARKRDKPRRKRKTRQQPRETLVPGEIEGELLEAPTEQPVSRARRVSTARQGDDGEGGALLPTEAWSGIGATLALLAGWSLERRRNRADVWNDPSSGTEVTA